MPPAMSCNKKSAADIIRGAQYFNRRHSDRRSVSDLVLILLAFQRLVLEVIARLAGDLPVP